MNIQTERLQDHSARFTVEVEAERLDKAKQAAARNIARKVDIPGFRRGKAPYKVLLNYVGEAAILEDAVEALGQEVYKQALGESEIDPYGFGQLEDFKVDPKPTFTFKVALQPTVELGDYRSVRLDYTPPEVSDEMVNRALKAIQEGQAVIEESRQPVALGNRVTLDIHSFVVNEGDEGNTEPESADEPAEAGQPPSIDDLHAHEDEEVFLHEHGAALRLSEEDEPILPGFSAALVGAVVDEYREFELTIPDDSEDYEKLSGQKVKFHIIVKRIETVTEPPLNDALAARVTEGEEKPLTLLELRMRVRDNLQKEAERQARANFSNRVLDKIVEQATVAYPEALVEEQVSELLNDLDRRLRQQGVTLDSYLKLVGKTDDDLRADYREPAIRSVERMLVMSELVRAEQLSVSEDGVTAQIDQLVGQYGEQSAGLRSVFDTPRMRSSIVNDLIMQQLYERLAGIGMGKAPEIAPATQEEAAEPEESTQA